MLYHQSEAPSKAYKRPYVPMDKSDVEQIQRAGSAYKGALSMAKQAWGVGDHVTAFRYGRQADKMRDEIFKKYDILL